MKFEINKRNFMNYVISLAALVGTIYLILGYSINKEYTFESSVFGIVEDFYYGNRDSSAVVKFKGTDDYYKLIGFAIPREQRNLLQKEDSIFKPMFSKEAMIYRKNENGDYKILTRVKVK